MANKKSSVKKTATKKTAETAPKPSSGKKTAGETLREYINQHEKNVETFAKKLGVGVASVYRWISISGPRSKVVKLALQQQTNGKVLAASWPPAKSRWDGHVKAVKKTKAGGKKKAAKKTASKLVKKAKPAATRSSRSKPAKAS